MTAPDHAFTQQPFVTAEDFEPETYFTYSFERQPGFEGDRFWQGASYPAREVRVGSVDAICELVKAGLGVSILSQWALYSYLRWDTIKATPITEQGLPIRWHAITRSAANKNSPEARTARALADWFASDEGQ
ncbi:MAG: substrate-binding domain-containing protein [Pseudomonadota bacterium]